MQKLIEILKERKLTISTCESCTGGLFASTLTSFPGVSSIYKGSVITYATEIKTDVVKVSETTVKEKGVVSSETAKEMAECTRRMMNTDLCISFTGNAGPDVMEKKPVGLVYCAISSATETEVFECHFLGNRNEIRFACVEAMTKNCIDFLGKRVFLTNHNCRR